MIQYGRSALRFTLAVVVLSMAPAYAANPQEFNICQATPDSPAKHKCVEKLLPALKKRAFGYPMFDTGWLDMVISWENYLGVHDSDYDRASATREAISKGNEQTAGAGDCLQQFTQLIGYYRSLGPEYKKYADQAKKTYGQLLRFGCSPPS
jgi:hypothetical protein